MFTFTVYQNFCQLALNSLILAPGQRALDWTAKSYLVTTTSQKQQKNNWSTHPLRSTNTPLFLSQEKIHGDNEDKRNRWNQRGADSCTTVCCTKTSVTANTFLEKWEIQKWKNKSFCRNGTTCFDWMIRAVKASEVWGKHCYYGCYYATVDHNSAPRNNEGVSTSNLFIAVYLCMNMHFNTTAAPDTLLPENENAWHSKPSHRHRGTLCLKLLME